MAYRVIQVKERFSLMFIVATELLNDRGQARFFSHHYWVVNKAGFLTHEILDSSEKELAGLVARDEYRK